MIDAHRFCVRKGGQSDVLAMADLLTRQRERYEKFAPMFWRLAEDHRGKTRQFLRWKILDPASVVLVCEANSSIEGFLIAAPVETPPVYDPGGPTVLVDDFCLDAGGDWDTTGRALLRELRAIAAERSWHQLVAVCAVEDTPKRRFLEAAGLLPTSIWAAASFSSLVLEAGE